MTLVRSAASETTQTVEALAITSVDERARVLAFSDGGSADEPTAPIHHVFEMCAAAAPTSLAVTDGVESLSYDELNRAANHLAHRLASLEVGRGQTVALCVDRSAQTLVGALGILKSGAAFVPLNADHPASRLAHQLEESGAAALVAQEPLLGKPASVLRPGDLPRPRHRRAGHRAGRRPRERCGSRRHSLT